MIYLYEMTSRTKVDWCNDELEIICLIETMEEFYAENSSYRFMIVNYDYKTTEPTLKAIDNYEELIQYKNDYLLRHKTAIELRREMMEIVYEQPKTKRLH